MIVLYENLQDYNTNISVNVALPGSVYPSDLPPSFLSALSTTSSPHSLPLVISTIKQSSNYPFSLAFLDPSFWLTLRGLNICVYYAIILT